MEGLNIFASTASILGALILLSVLVFFHELGHYAVGRFFGFGIREFAIGFGPKLLSRVAKNGTRYSIRVFPLGGFCAFYGEDEVPDDDPRSFNNHAAWKRFLLQLAGPVMNVVLALLLALVFINRYGSDIPVINRVAPDSPAMVAGIEPGDIVRAVEGETVLVHSFADAMTTVDHPDVRLTIERAGQPLELTIQRTASAEGGYGLVGIEWSRLKLPFLQTFGASARMTFGFVREILNALQTMFVQPERIATDFTGPVGTVAIIGESITYGFSVILLMSCFLSVNLCVFNLLPFPGLDGGRMIFSAIEMIMKRPVSQRIEGAVHAAGLMLLMAFIIFLTFGDISRIVSG